MSALHILMSRQISNSAAWLDRIDGINSYLNQLSMASPPQEKVKIALLDTGCDPDQPCILGITSAESRLCRHWHDWAGDSVHPIDQDSSKHGTVLFALLMRIAPHAEIFVGRVAKSKGGIQTSADSIAEVSS